MTQTAEQHALEVEGLTKRFGHVEALRGVSFSVGHGEVVGLVGDNGAGKSTVVKIVAGTIQPDAGQIRIGGRPIRIRTAKDARSHGIETVFQELALAPDLTAIQNLFLGREHICSGVGHLTRALDERRMRRETPRRLGQLSARLPALDVPVRMLSGGQRQIIAIARAAAWASKVVLMDEPTAALGLQQTEEVINLIRSMADAGMSVVVISHNLPELLTLIDRVIVLRLGTVVDDAPRSDLSVDRLIQAMTGLRKREGVER